jgi:hypothetical protein
MPLALAALRWSHATGGRHADAKTKSSCLDAVSGSAHSGSSGRRSAVPRPQLCARPSIRATVTETYDDALAETTSGLSKTECVHGPGAPTPLR